MLSVSLLSAGCRSGHGQVHLCGARNVAKGSARGDTEAVTRCWYGLVWGNLDALGGRRCKCW